jgi:catechol 2,3-dioxygenase-like lactoylglutathione lyase family enzyme
MTLADPGLRHPIPILRMYDVEATKRFYVDYLGFTLDWQEGAGDRPVYLRVSRGPVAFHLSSHAGDGTPGTAVVIQVDDVEALHRELASKRYPFMNPGIDPRGIGREMLVLDPASNQIRFFEPGRPEDA